ncbi:MAG: choice-of-anchor L domain-containing protein [Bacteroidota bacterium]
MTPEQLVASWLVGNGISISNVKFNGSSASITSNQIGTFTTAGTALTELGLNAGIVMTSGTAVNTVGPNNTCGKSFAAGTSGDPDLNIIAGVNTHDAAVLEFDFIPESDTLRFRYVFGSEEIWYYCYSYNDAFGFFLSGPGINGTFSNNAVNIAIMPGSMSWVTLNNMCDNPDAIWCNAPVNCPKSGHPPPSYANCQDPLGKGVNLQYNGLTYIFTAWYAVIPCSTYHIKLAVGDALDQALDSGVFLEKNSFSAAGLTISTNFIPPLRNYAIEGCSNAIISFKMPQVTPLPYVINYTIGGTAINGVDYTTIPNFVTIPAGQSSTTLTISPIYDGISEGTETVILDIAQASCFGSQSIIDTILIDDNTTFFISAGPDDTICLGDTSTLTATAWGGQRPYTYGWVGFPGSDSIVKVSPGLGNHQYILMVSEGCGVSDQDTMQLLVNPVPVATAVPVSNPVCSGSSITITLQSSLPGSTFSWIASNPAGHCTGFFSGSGNIILQTLTNTSYAVDSVSYTVTAVKEGCTSAPVTVWMKVNPLPNTIASPATSSLCHGQTTAIGLTTNVTGSTFAWTATCSNPNIYGFSGGNGAGILQTLFTSAFTPDTVFYHITATATGCQGSPETVSVIVKPIHQVSFPVCFDTLTTTQAQPFPLKGAIPPGGTFSGAGVNGSTFYPSLAGSGSHPIRYSYTNNYSCTDSVFRTIHVADPVSHICGDTLTDIRDNKKYPTVLIGTQCWLAANLNHGQQISSSTSQRDNCVVEKYCYNDIPAYCISSGGRYQWDEVMAHQSAEGIQGLCPPGWHLPIENEWITLFSQYINNGFAGSALKITGYSGFNALLAGFQGYNLVWKYGPTHPVLRATLYWSSTARGTNKAWAHGMNEVVADIEYTPSVSFYPSYRSNAFSVRCIKD